MKITCTGQRELLRRLRALSDEDFQAVAAQAVRQTAESAAAHARKKAPMGKVAGSGQHLAQSIHVEMDATGEHGASATVSTAARHAQYVEFGTGWPIGHQVYTLVTTKTGKRYQIKGWIYPARDGGFRVTQGMAPRPFMRPAYRKAARELPLRIRQALERLGSG